MERTDGRTPSRAYSSAVFARLVHHASMLEPAHFTKHNPLLSVALHSSSFSIAQLDDGKQNGTAVWLSGQVLALALPALLSDKRKGRLIELGSGTGFAACV